jgi:hypothetical protein
MYVLTTMFAVPALNEDAGVDEVVAVLSESRQRTMRTAEARMRRGIRGEITEWGEAA